MADTQSLKPWQFGRALFRIDSTEDLSQEVRNHRIGLLLTDLLEAGGDWSRNAVISLLRGHHGQANAESATFAMRRGCRFRTRLAPLGVDPLISFGYWCLHFGRIDVLGAVATMGLEFAEPAGTGATTDAGDALDHLSCLDTERFAHLKGELRRWSFVKELGRGRRHTDYAWKPELLDAAAALLARVDPGHADFQAEVANGTELGARFARAAMAQKMASAQLPTSSSTPPVPGSSHPRRRALGV